MGGYWKVYCEGMTKKSIIAPEPESAPRFYVFNFSESVL